MKAATLESKFPLLAVEHDCIISKDADITVAYKVELPELLLRIVFIYCIELRQDETSEGEV